MSIRLIAKDLYRLEKEVGQLEKALEESPLKKRADLQDKLRKATAERNRMRGILEGSKGDVPYRKPL